MESKQKRCQVLSSGFSRPCSTLPWCGQPSHSTYFPAASGCGVVVALPCVSGCGVVVALPCGCVVVTPLPLPPWADCWPLSSLDLSCRPTARPTVKATTTSKPCRTLHTKLLVCGTASSPTGRHQVRKCKSIALSTVLAGNNLQITTVLSTVLAGNNLQRTAVLSTPPPNPAGHDLQKC